jgi:hypothetical protein
MRSQYKVLTAAAALMFVLSAPAKAQIIFYNGDFNGTNGLASEQDQAVSSAIVYDNFMVGAGGWTVNGVFGNFLTNLTFDQAYFEIRSGVSSGDGGTLLFSGTYSASRTATGRSGFGFSEYTGEIDGLNFFLGAGEYWLGINVIADQAGRAFLSTTGGANGVNALSDGGNSYFTSAFFGANFAPAESQLGFASDFSIGLLGSTENIIPEPGTMTLLATGLLGLAGAARRKRARG